MGTYSGIKVIALASANQFQSVGNVVTTHVMSVDDQDSNDATLNGGTGQTITIDGNEYDGVSNISTGTIEIDGMVMTGTRVLMVSSTTSSLSDFFIPDDNQMANFDALTSGSQITTTFAAEPNSANEVDYYDMLTPPEKVIDGTSGDDSIDANYAGDPTGDMVDNADSPTGTDDDVIYAGSGDDTIDAGAGGDMVMGEGGDDVFIVDNNLANDLYIGGENEETEGDTIDASSMTNSVQVDLEQTVASSYKVLMFDGEMASFTSNGEQIYYSSTQSFKGESEAYILDFDTPPSSPDKLETGSDASTTKIYIGDTIYSDVTYVREVSLFHPSEGALVGYTVIATPEGGSKPVGLFFPKDGANNIDGYLASQHVGVTLTSDQTPDMPYDQLIVTDTVTGGIMTDDAAASIRFSEMENIVLGSGDDTLNGGDEAVNADTGAGNDSVTTGDGDDVIAGGDGDDTIDAGNGNNIIDAGAGANTVTTGTGDDSVTSGNGADTIDTGDGNDTVNAGGGDNDITAGAGNDSVTTGDGDDTINAGNGANVIDAGTGTNTVTTGAGADSITSGDGDDNINSGAGNDTINAGGGDNSIDAGEGDDSVTTGDGNDTITVGTGNDTIDAGNGENNITAAGGDNAITTGSGDDIIATGGGADTVNAGAGNDVVTAGSGNNTIDAGDGADSVTTGAGNDLVTAGAGNDSISTGAGDDTVNGGEGADVINAGAGQNVIDAGAGNDAITISGGDNSVTGGAGDDEFIYAGSGNANITDFGAGSTVSGFDGNSDNNDVLDLSDYYNKVADLRADFADDGILNQSNAGTDYSDLQKLDGSITFKNDSGEQYLTANDFNADNTNLLCFADSVMVTTLDGECRVGDLKQGDMVLTLDNGFKPVSWIGRRTLDAVHFDAMPNHRAIRIRAGALGNNTPTQDLIVSPQHRILVCSDVAQRIAGKTETLVAAKHLVGLPGIEIANDLASVTYVHVMFDQHEVIFAEGAAAESFYTGEMAMAALSADSLREIFEIFPELQSADFGKSRAARPFMKGSEGRELVKQLLKNNQITLQ